MKKRAVTAIALALAAFMAFAACGKSPEPVGESSDTSMAEVSEESSSQLPDDTSSEDESIASTSEESASTEEAEESSEEDEADLSDVSVYATEMQKVLDALSDFYGDAIKIETSTEGNNTLVITYTLLNDSLGINAENIAESMAAEGSKMEELASEMESGGIPSPVVLVKWIDTDGSELFNKEYK